LYQQQNATHRRRHLLITLTFLEASLYTVTQRQLSATSYLTQSVNVQCTAFQSHNAHNYTDNCIPYLYFVNSITAYHLQTLQQKLTEHQYKIKHQKQK